MTTPWVDTEAINAAKMYSRITALIAALQAAQAVSYDSRVNVTNQSIPNAAETTIVGWSHVGGATGLGITYAVGIWTIVTPGFYTVAGQVGYDSIASPTGQRSAFLYFNGTMVSGCQDRADTAYFTSLPFSGGQVFAAGDTINVTTYQSQGSTQTLAATAGYNHIHIQRIGNG